MNLNSFKDSANNLSINQGKQNKQNHSEDLKSDLDQDEEIGKDIQSKEFDLREIEVNPNNSIKKIKSQLKIVNNKQELNSRKVEIQQSKRNLKFIQETHSKTKLLKTDYSSLKIQIQKGNSNQQKENNQMQENQNNASNLILIEENRQQDAIINQQNNEQQLSPPKFYLNIPQLKINDLDSPRINQKNNEKIKKRQTNEIQQQVQQENLLANPINEIAYMKVQSIKYKKEGVPLIQIQRSASNGGQRNNNLMAPTLSEISKLNSSIMSYNQSQQSEEVSELNCLSPAQQKDKKISFKRIESNEFSNEKSAERHLSLTSALTPSFNGAVKQSTFSENTELSFGGVNGQNSLYFEKNQRLNVQRKS